MSIIVGQASFYSNKFQGRRTACGDRFDQNGLTAAHKTLPCGTRVRVTNTITDQSVVVRVNDRGPYCHGRVIDLSRAAAGSIGMLGRGVVPVKVEVLGRAETASAMAFSDSSLPRSASSSALAADPRAATPSSPVDKLLSSFRSMSMSPGGRAPLQRSASFGGSSVSSPRRALQRSDSLKTALA